MPRLKTKLDPAMIPVVDRLIRKGHPLETVAGAIGVSLGVFNKWRAEGEKEDCTDPLLAEFAGTIHSARGAINGQVADLMLDHAKGDWKAAHAVAKALQPEVWVERKELKIDQKVEHKDEDLSHFTTDELLAMKEIRDRAAQRAGKA